MSPEIPMQRDMFSGELVDVRSSRQKQRDRERELPQPLEMFSQRELAQFGVKAHPKLPISPKTRLELAMEDRRTEEEIEADRMKAAQDNTYPMFEETSPGPAEASLPKPRAGDDEVETRP